jgi:hypothetical protein
MNLWEEIDKRMSSFGYMTQIERSKQRVAETAEIFTPTPLVIEILKKVDVMAFAPGKVVLDPACGDGQFLLAAKLIKVLHFHMDEDEALSEIYGVDIMRDNVELCKKRLGGGNIFLGNSLDPQTKLEGQTQHEHSKMKDIFGSELQIKRASARKSEKAKSDDDLWVDFLD